MNPKIKLEHLTRAAVVYVRQSTLGQVEHHTESQRRRYSLVDTAAQLGFASVETIDDDLGRSGSGLVERPGFQKLVAMVCSGSVGGVLCPPSLSGGRDRAGGRRDCSQDAEYDQNLADNVTFALTISEFRCQRISVANS